MKTKLFHCNAGRNFIDISIDFWNDFKEFFNQYDPNTQYRISYKYLILEDFNLSNSNTLNDFLHSQLEILRLIIMKKEDDLDHHEILKLLKSSLKNFAMIKHLLNGSKLALVREYLRFMEEQITPIYNLNIDFQEDILKIKHHKSFVRNKIEEFGDINLQLNIISSEKLELIKQYFDHIIPDHSQKSHFFQEFFQGRENEIIYKLDIKETKKVCEFFKYLHGTGYIIAEKAALAKWMNRKFQRIDNGKVIGTIETLKKYLHGNHDSQILNKIEF